MQHLGLAKRLCVEGLHLLIASAEVWLVEVIFGLLALQFLVAEKFGEGVTIRTLQGSNWVINKIVNKFNRR